MKMSDYVETDIGEFPKDWDVRKLNEIAKLQRGLSYSGREKSKDEIPDGYLFLTLNSVKEGGGLKEDGWTWIKSDRLKERHFVREGNIVIANTEQSKDGSLIGSPAIVNFPEWYKKDKAVFSHHISKLLLKVSNLNVNFLFYYLSFVQPLARKYHTGTGVWGLNVDSWAKDLLVPLPPLEEQKKIVELLQKATDIYYTLKDYIIQIRNSTETITKVIRKELLTKGIGHRDYVETDIGEFPMEWDVKRLNELAKIIMGQSPPSSAYNNKGQGLPFLQGSKDFGDIYPSIKTFTTICKKKAPKDSILLSVRAPVGDINISDREICIGRGIAAIVPHNKIDLIYLYYYLTYSTFKIKRYSSGTTFESIKKSDLENFQIPLPPLEEQKKIVELLQKVNELIIRFNDFLQNLEDEANTLYKSILRLALTGKLTEDWRRQIILLRSVVIPYLVYQASKIKGRPVYMTELMKYLFLLQKEYNINLAYNFESYKYGPFTPQLYKDLEELKDRIEVKEVKDNVDKSLITSKELPQVNQDIANAVNDLINRFGNKDLKELLSYVYKKYPEYTVKSELNLDEFLK